MATLRTLTTRFNFETDTQGVQNFRNVMSGMKKTVLGVAAAFGTGAAATAIAKLGVGLESAAVSAARLSDDISLLDGSVKLTGEVADSFERVKKSIPGRVNLAGFLRSFTSFRQLLRDRPLEDFNTLFETAGRIAVIQGGNIEDSFNRIAKSATSGDFQPLQEIFPGFDILDKNMQGFIQRLLEVDPTNVNNVKISLDRFLEVIKKNESELAQFARTVNDETAAGQFRLMFRNIKEVGSIIGVQLAGPMKEALAVVNSYFKAWIDGERTLSQILDNLSREITQKFSDNPILGPVVRLAQKFGIIEEEEDRLDIPVRARGKEEKRATTQRFFGGGLNQQLFEARQEAIRQQQKPKRAVERELELIEIPTEGGQSAAQPTGINETINQNDQKTTTINNTFAVTLNEAQNPRAIVEELRRFVVEASAGFNPIEGIA